MTIEEKVRDAVIKAGTTFSDGLKQAYHNAIQQETEPNAKWALERILENALIAENNKLPLCDDTGIPHLFLEMGKNRSLSGGMLESIHEGIRQGLRALPGRPMSIEGNEIQRLDQSGGLNPDPAGVSPAPLIIKPIDEDDVLRLHVLLFGGGPSIRGRTYRVFHKHNIEVLLDHIVSWASEAVGLLGCSPCTLAIGIGRSHFEAVSLAVEAQVYGQYAVQNDLEIEITKRVNEKRIGALGLGGKISVLATFLKVGPQRASGVRIVSLHPCCCIEPRVASVDL
jgi:fumarate hydratase subunit alpha